jgi:hypothetical protein
MGVMNATETSESIDATTIRVLFTVEERAEFEQFVSKRGLKKGAFAKFAIMNEITRERRDEIEALR